MAFHRALAKERAGKEVIHSVFHELRDPYRSFIRYKLQVPISKSGAKAFRLRQSLQGQR
jgi:hypothetical protein